MDWEYRNIQARRKSIEFISDYFTMFASNTIQLKATHYG